MTKEEALYQFWSGFGLVAMEENSIPTDDADRPDFPYLTYTVATGDFGTEVALSASLWYRSASWVDVNAKKDEISRAIGYGGTFLPSDGGGIWLKRGTPFSQSTGDPADNMIKRNYLNVIAEFLSAD